MQDRRAATRRIVAVRAQMHRTAEWELARIRREQAELEQNRAGVMETLNSTLFGPLLVDMVSRTLKRLSLEATRLAADAEAQAERVQAQAFALKRAERMAERVERETRAHEDRKAFQELAESAALRPGAAASKDASLT
ncbi:hypothetical protein [Roseixanthobacter liquoris]|uniref:hypothetical protein n=1 Tax=Roseixanthobacter liquoris TaxID=3119921 RepID=UPI00372730D0